MKIQNITDFVTLADKLDYTLAAKKLFITPADLSESISELEEELGTALFINNARNEIVLTELGEIFLRGARNIEKQYEQTISTLNHAKGKPQRTLRIGHRYDASQDETPYITRALRTFAPTISPVYHLLTHGAIMEQLKDGEIDVAVGIVVDDAPFADFNTVSIESDHYEVVCPLDHPFAKMDSVTLRQVAADSVIIPNPRTMATMNQFFTNIFKDAHVDMVQSAYYDDVDSLVLQIEEGAGVSMVLSGRRSHFGDRVAFVPVSDPIPEARVELIWLPETEKRIPGNWLEAFKALSID